MLLAVARLYSRDTMSAHALVCGMRGTQVTTVYGTLNDIEQYILNHVCTHSERLAATESLSNCQVSLLHHLAASPPLAHHSPTTLHRAYHTPLA